MEKFIERLNDLRNGITLEKLANDLGIGHSTVLSWTSRQNMPKLDNIILLSNYFKCSIEYLLGRSDDNSEIPPKDCPPFHSQLKSILESNHLKTTHLRNKGIISSGLNESIFKNHSIPFIDTVIKIADYLKVSVDELVGRV